MVSDWGGWVGNIGDLYKQSATMTTAMEISLYDKDLAAPHCSQQRTMLRSGPGNWGPAHNPMGQNWDPKEIAAKGDSSSCLLGALCWVWKGYFFLEM